MLLTSPINPDSVLGRGLLTLDQLEVLKRVGIPSHNLVSRIALAANDPAHRAVDLVAQSLPTFAIRFRQGLAKRDTDRRHDAGPLPHGHENEAAIILCAQHANYGLLRFGPAGAVEQALLYHRQFAHAAREIRRRLSSQER